MGDIEFTCPHCKASLEVEEGAIGTTLDCPGCNRPVVVPTPPVPDPAPHQRVAGQAAKERPQKAESGMAGLTRTSSFVNGAQDPGQAQVATKMARTRTLRLWGAACGGLGLCLACIIQPMDGHRLGSARPAIVLTALTLSVGLLAASGVLLALPHSRFWGRWALGYLLGGLLCVLVVAVTQGGGGVQGLGLAIGGLGSILAALVLPFFAHGAKGTPVQPTASRGRRRRWVAIAGTGLLTAAVAALLAVWVRRYLVLLHGDGDESTGALILYIMVSGMLLPLAGGMAWVLYCGIWTTDRTVDASAMGHLVKFSGSQSFEELMGIAEKGFLHGIDDATREAALQAAMGIARRENDMRKIFLVNAALLSLRKSGRIR